MSTFYLCRTYKPYTRYSGSRPATRRSSTGVHAKAARQTGWYVYTGEGGGGGGGSDQRPAAHLLGSMQRLPAKPAGMYILGKGEGGGFGSATRRSSTGVHAKAARQTGWYVYTGEGGGGIYRESNQRPAAHLLGSMQRLPAKPAGMYILGRGGGIYRESNQRPAAHLLGSMQRLPAKPAGMYILGMGGISRVGPATRRSSTGIHTKVARQTGWYVYTGGHISGVEPATRRSSTGVNAKAVRQTGWYVYTGGGIYRESNQRPAAHLLGSIQRLSAKPAGMYILGEAYIGSLTSGPPPIYWDPYKGCPPNRLVCTSIYTIGWEGVYRESDQRSASHLLGQCMGCTINRQVFIHCQMYTRREEGIYGESDQRPTAHIIGSTNREVCTLYIQGVGMRISMPVLKGLGHKGTNTK